VLSFGWGAPQPGGGGYPTLYFWGWVKVGGVTWTLGMWQSTNANQVTPTYTNLSPSDYPNHDIQDYDITVTGDFNVYGRVYVGTQNQGTDYYDSSDACPWVKWSNTNPTDSLTGTVSLQATASGLVPITAVDFYADGTLIGRQTIPSSGSGTSTSPYVYSQNWNASAITGAHTLKVLAEGSTNVLCTTSLTQGNSFSIPVTSH
jgi:hypothetical protein